MTLVQNFNEAASASASSETPGTHNVRVRFNETDAGQVSGPFSLSAAQAFAVAAIGRADVVRATLELVGGA